MKKVLQTYLKFIVIIFVFCLFGCTTVTKNKSGLDIYNINGINYCALSNLSQIKGLDFEYDLLTRSVSLRKGSHKISLLLGEKLLIVDNKPVYLKQPVDIYKGMLVVPYKFQEQILDVVLNVKSVEIKKVISFNNIKKIVIDPGHGGNDPGAIGKTGLREKDVVLDISRRLKKILNDLGVTVVMTRDTDKFIPLNERVNIANRVNADLFVSVHANANPSRSLNGFEVYYISSSVSDVQRAIVSTKQVKLNFANSSFAQSSSNLKSILWDMIHSYNRAQAIELSRSICKEMGLSTDARIIGVKSANFCVLRGTCMPAALVEVGFVSNKMEEQLLKDNLYRQRLAEAIKGGIEDYSEKLDNVRVIGKNDFAQDNLDDSEIN